MNVTPKRYIYHITHVDNLSSIIKDGGLRSDAAVIARDKSIASIGMSTIKQRRLNLPVKCHPKDFVGDYGTILFLLAFSYAVPNLPC